VIIAGESYSGAFRITSRFSPTATLCATQSTASIHAALISTCRPGHQLRVSISR
jgi:hypothetical protein